MTPTALNKITYLIQYGFRDTYESFTPTMTLLTMLIVASWIMYYNDSNLQKEMIVYVNKQNQDNFEILRDILQENNKDICSVRDDVRSIRKSLRSAKAKVEETAE